MALRLDHPPRSWWNEIHKCLANNLSLSIKCSTQERARTVAQALDKYRRRNDGRFLISKRGAYVFVWQPPTKEWEWTD